MAYTTINKSTDYFNTVTYSGNGNNNHTITGVGFDADFVWNKLRSGTDDNRLFDKVRGINKYVESSNTTAEVTDAILSTNSDGYVLTDAGEVNSNTGTYVGWNWKANGAGSANTDGTISSTVSANTTAGFSIVSYSGSNSNSTVGHGLGSAPRVIIIKRLNTTDNWRVLHMSAGNDNTAHLNLTDAFSSSGVFQNTSPTSTVFSLVGNNTSVNQSGSTYIAYCFADVKGFSKFGKFTGNGSTDGTFIYTGFKPSFWLQKRSDGSGGWVMYDNKRAGYNPKTDILYANDSASEDASNSEWADIVSNGFKYRTVGGNDINNSRNEYIYMAFAESPFVTSIGIPTTAR